MTPNKMPPIIGLTGGIACGKSHLSAALKAHGATVIDADEISRSLTAPGGPALPRIRKRFGDGVFDGADLNRQRLAARVFGDREELAALNGIVHPLVFQEIDAQLALHRLRPALVVDLPLLYETGFENRCREVWAAYAPEDLQLRRLQDRGLSLVEAQARIQSQMPAMEKARRADHVIETTGSKQQSAQAVIRLYEAFLRRYALV